MKKLLSVLIVAVMLIGMIPFAFAADSAPASIKLDEKKTVSVDRYTPNNTFEFVAPESSEYYIYSESEDCDPYVAIFDKSGKKILSNDDGREEYDFGCYIELEKGQVIVIKARSYNALNKATYTMSVTEVKAATKIITDKSEIVTYADKWVHIEYSFAPIGAHGDYVKITSSNEDVLTVSEDNSAYALKEGTAVLTLETETGLTATVNVTVATRDSFTPGVDKTGKVDESGVEYKLVVDESGWYDFEFTTSDYGCLYLKQEELGYIDETNGESGRFDSYLEAGLEYVIGCYSHNVSEKIDYSISVKKSSPATEIYLENEKGEVQPIEFASWVTAYGFDGYIDGKIEWSVDDPTVARIVPIDYTSDTAVLDFYQPGMVVVTAKVGDMTTEIMVTGVRSPKLELDKPVDFDVTENSYDSVFCFTPEKDGMYRILTPASSIGVYGDDNYFDGYEFVDCELKKDIEYHITVSSYETDSSRIIVNELKDATSLSFVNGDSITVYENIEVFFEFVSNGLLGEVEVSMDGPAETEYLFVSGDEVYTFFTQTGDYTLTITSGELTATLKIKVVDYKPIAFNQTETFKLDKNTPDMFFEFKAKEDGIVSLNIESDTELYVHIYDSGEEFGTEINRNINCYEQESVLIRVNLLEADTANVTLSITEPQYAKSLITPVDNYVMSVGDEIWIEEFFVFNPMTSWEELTYTSSNEDVLKVTYDKVVAKSEGTATITAESQYGLKATLKITVVNEYDWATAIDIENPEITLDAGKSEIIKATAVAESKKSLSFVSLDTSVARVDSNGRVTGIAEGEAIIAVGVDNIIEVVVITVNAPEIAESAKVFKDVKAGKWYTKAIDYAYSYGFIAGTSANEFGRDTNVNRGMFITILARIAGVDTGKEANKTTTKFTDVKSGKYYTAAIKWANENGVVSGTGDTTFSPEASISRQDLCVMVTNFAKYMNIDVTASKAELAFKDASTISKYAKNAVKICQMAGIVNGYNDGTFGPKKTATRAEAAQILYVFHSTFIAK